MFKWIKKLFKKEGKKVDAYDEAMKNCEETIRNLNEIAFKLTEGKECRKELVDWLYNHH